MPVPAPRSKNPAAGVGGNDVQKLLRIFQNRRINHILGHLAEFGPDIAHQKQSTSRAQSDRSLVARRVGSIGDDQAELIHDLEDFGSEQFLKVGHAEPVHIPERA